MSEKKPITFPAMPTRRPTSSEEWNAILNQVAIEREEHIHLRKVFDAISEGVLRTCYFIEQKPDDKLRALVTTESGDDSIVVMKEPDMFRCLKRGDKVLVKDGLILETCPTNSSRGDIMTLERVISPTKLEVSHEGKRMVCWSSEQLGREIESGAVKSGRQLIVKPGPAIAFEAIPEPTGLNRFQFLLQEPPPDINVDRDIGCPPKCIEEITSFIRVEMCKAAIHRRYNIRSLVMKLLQGVSGSGKTLAIRAIWRIVYEIMAEITKVPLSELPFRVFRMKASQMLSQWLGQSDKNFDRFFDEVDQMARTEFEYRGKKYTLPTLVILEEIDGIARQRGQDHDGIYDRILTTALQRLDPSVMVDRPVVFIATTNEPGAIDHAFLRRIGGSIEHFGMLQHDAFPKVLEKHVAKVPIQSDNGTSQTKLRGKLIEEMTTLFYIKEQPHVVELTIGTQNVPKYRRDFMTPALIDRAVQQAAKHTVTLEMEGKADGISAAVLNVAFKQQINSIVAQLNPSNAHRYLTIPEGAKVTKVKHAERPSKSANPEG